MNELNFVSDECLEIVSGGNPDGGQPMQTHTTTTTTTSVSASGTINGGFKIIKGKAEGSVTTTSETTVQTIQPCPAPQEQWRGTPYR
ncbi:MAG TPA: hypothetical protein VGF45_24710 [Polyangia bacterium]